MACCGRGTKATTTQVYVLTAPNGERTEHATKGDAEAAKVAAGGGVVTPVRK